MVKQRESVENEEKFGVQKQTLSGLYNELKLELGKTYSGEELARFWGGADYPGTYAHFNTHACRDTITHFVDGLGDLNPLYRDLNYSRRTKHARLVAPPTFIFTIACGVPAPSVRPGLMGYHAGFDIEWWQNIYEGDALHTVSTYPSDLKLNKSRMGGRSLSVYADTLYTKELQVPVARCREWAIITDTKNVQEIGYQTSSFRPHRYTAAEIQEIHEAQDQENIRGAVARYWEDVTVGEQLTPVIRGPFNAMDSIVWLMGCGNQISKQDRIYRKIDSFERMINHPVTHAPINLELCHMNEQVAEAVGLPTLYDFGAQRIAWLSILLTNWMGDDGFLWKFRAELRKFNMMGDTTWFKGEVTAKYIEQGSNCVEVKCFGQNQRGEITTPGQATIILPSRTGGPVKIPVADQR